MAISLGHVDPPRVVIDAESFDKSRNEDTLHGNDSLSAAYNSNPKNVTLAHRSNVVVEVAPATKAQYLAVATSRGFPHVEQWFMNQATSMRDETLKLQRNCEAEIQSDLHQHHLGIVSGRESANTAREKHLDGLQHLHSVRQHWRALGAAWVAAFREAAASYMTELRETESTLLRRRQLAEEWTVHGEREAVMQRLAKVEERRSMLTARIARDTSRESLRRAHTLQGLRESMEKLVGEVGDAISWELQQRLHGRLPPRPDQRKVEDENSRVYICVDDEERRILEEEKTLEKELRLVVRRNRQGRFGTVRSSQSRKVRKTHPKGKDTPTPKEITTTTTTTTKDKTVDGRAKKEKEEGGSSSNVLHSAPHTSLDKSSRIATVHRVPSVPCDSSTREKDQKKNRYSTSASSLPPISPSQQGSQKQQLQHEEESLSPSPPADLGKTLERSEDAHNVSRSTATDSAMSPNVNPSSLPSLGQTCPTARTSLKGGSFAQGNNKTSLWTQKSSKQTQSSTQPITTTTTTPNVTPRATIATQTTTIPSPPHPHPPQMYNSVFRRISAVKRPPFVQPPNTAGRDASGRHNADHLAALLAAIKEDAAHFGHARDDMQLELETLREELRQHQATTKQLLQTNVELESERVQLEVQREAQLVRLREGVANRRTRLSEQDMNDALLDGDLEQTLELLQTQRTRRLAEMQQLQEQVNTFEQKMHRHITIMQQVREYWRRNAAAVRRMRNANNWRAIQQSLFSVMDEPITINASQQLSPNSRGDTLQRSGSGASAGTPLNLPQGDWSVNAPSSFSSSYEMTLTGNAKRLAMASPRPNSRKIRAHGETIAAGGVSFVEVKSASEGQAQSDFAPSATAPPTQLQGMLMGTHGSARMAPVKGEEELEAYQSIPALGLVEPDEVAEFIYSVFEESMPPGESEK